MPDDLLQRIQGIEGVLAGMELPKLDRPGPEFSRIRDLAFLRLGILQREMHPVGVADAILHRIGSFGGVIVAVRQFPAINGDECGR